jgi:hypothetical protein
VNQRLDDMGLIPYRSGGAKKNAVAPPSGLVRGRRPGCSGA